MLKTPPLNLSQLLPWHKVMPVLGIEPPAGILPCSLNCPLCGSVKLTIFNDTVFNGEWYYCDGCKACGDMVQLAAAVWGLTEQDAYVTLSAKLGIPAHVGEPFYHYKHYLIDARVRSNDFWKSASKQLVSGHVLRQMRLDMHIAFNTDETSWRAKGGAYIGAASRNDIDELIKLSTDNKLFERMGNIEAKHCKEAMVIPFWDYPGRLSAFIFAAPGHDGKMVAARYRTLVPYCRNTNGEATYAMQTRMMPDAAGVAMLHALYENGSGTAFVLLDPFLALRSQIKHLELNPGHPAALVGIRPESVPAMALRDHSASRRLVLFAEEVTADLIKHARAVKGLIAPPHAHGETTIDFLRRITTEQWLLKLDKDAMPWEEALERKLASATNIEAEAMLHRLDWPQSQLDEFIDACPSKLRERLRPLIEQGKRFKSIDIDNKTIVETSKGWENTKTGEVISDGVIRIEQILHNPKTRENQYKGYVQHHGARLDFTVAQPVFDKNPFKWVDNFLISNGNPSLLYAASYRRHALNIAKKFHPPTTVIGAHGYGWDEHGARFVFPEYVIATDGEVIEDKLPVEVTERAPALSLLKPDTLSPMEVALMSDAERDTDLAWQMLTLVAHNLLAPAFGYSPVGTVVLGSHFSLIKKLAQAMGCPNVQLKTWAAPKHISSLKAIENEASWPVVFECTVPRSITYYTWLVDQPHNCFIGVELYAALCLAISGGWYRLEGETSELRPQVVTVACKMIPAFIKYMMSRRLRRHKPQGDTLTRMKHDVAGWFASLGGKSVDVIEATDAIYQDYDGSATDAFFELTFDLFEAQTLRMVDPWQSSYSRLRLPAMVKFEDIGCLWIPKQGINAALGRRNVFVPALDTSIVSQALYNSGVLVEEKIHNGIPGWLISGDAWVTRYQAWSRKRGFKRVAK